MLNSLGGIAVPLGASNYLLGIAVLLLTILVLFLLARMDLEHKPASSLPVMMTAFGLPWDAFLLVGRSSYGPGKALESTYYLYQFIGIYLFLAVSRDRSSPDFWIKWRRASLSVMLAVTCVEVPLAMGYMTEHGDTHMVFMQIVRNAIG